MFIDRRRPLDAQYVTEAAQYEAAKAHRDLVKRDLGRVSTAEILETLDVMESSESGSTAAMKVRQADFLLDEEKEVGLLQSEAAYHSLSPSDGKQHNQVMIYESRIISRQGPTDPYYAYRSYLYPDGTGYTERFDLDALPTISAPEFALLDHEAQEVILNEERTMGRNCRPFDRTEIDLLAQDSVDAPKVVWID